MLSVIVPALAILFPLVTAGHLNPHGLYQRGSSHQPHTHIRATSENIIVTAKTIPALPAALLRDPPPKAPRLTPNAGFVSVRDGHFYLGDRLWDFRGFNAPALLESNIFEVEDTMRSLLLGFARPVTRTYTLRVGPSYAQTAEQAHIIGWDADKQDWKYNEDQFKAFDQVLATAAKYGVKVILPIINQDYGREDSDYKGNFRDLIRQRFSILNYTVAQQEVDFFTNSTIRSDFLKIIKYLLNRVNTVNGRVYGSDDTFLAFQTGNEMNWLIYHANGTVEDRGAPPADWTLDVARTIRKYAPKTLIVDGSFSRTLDKGLSLDTLWRNEVLQSDVVDLFDYHLYGSGDGYAITKINNYVRGFGKIFTPLETGFYDTIANLKNITSLDQSASNLLWSLRPHSDLGGFVVHGEGNNIFSYHVPGWRPPRDPSNFDAREQDTIDVARNASYTTVNAPVPGFHPIPFFPPIPFATTVNGTKALSFKGAAWAKTYDVYEVKTGGGLDWFKRLTNVTDNVKAGSFAFPVPLAEPGQPQPKTNASGAWYLVVAKSVEGIPGSFGGPFYIAFN